MRSTEQMLSLIKTVAESENCVKSAILCGSRANENAPKDIYQDYDVVYFVSDIKPYFNNINWLEEKFGKAILMQTPDIIDYPELTAETAEKFTFLAIFSDGVRVDLTLTTKSPEQDAEPFLVLLDKCGMLDGIECDADYYNVKMPTQREFSNCCNEFWWCLNNVAKGLARREIPYAKDMFDGPVRAMLNQMLSYYIGTFTDFSVSIGKAGKYLNKYLTESTYNKYLKSYSSTDPDKMWNSVINTCKLFSDVAIYTANTLGLEYNALEEKGAREYMINVKNKVYE